MRRHPTEEHGIDFLFIDCKGCLRLAQMLDDGYHSVCGLCQSHYLKLALKEW